MKNMKKCFAVLLAGALTASAFCVEAFASTQTASGTYGSGGTLPWDATVEVYQYSASASMAIYGSQARNKYVTIDPKIKYCLANKDYYVQYRTVNAKGAAGWHQNVSPAYIKWVDVSYYIEGHKVHTFSHA